MTKEDYKAALEAKEKLMENIQRKNEELVKAVKFYANTNWRTLSLLDRGTVARRVLK